MWGQTYWCPQYHKVAEATFLRALTKYHKVVKATSNGLDDVPLSCQGHFLDRVFSGFCHGPKQPKKEEEELEEEDVAVEPSSPVPYFFQAVHMCG